MAISSRDAPQGKHIEGCQKSQEHATKFLSRMSQFDLWATVVIANPSGATQLMNLLQLNLD